MYKSRLQEICRKKLWDLPEYTSSRDGPDHNPRFRASVTVNGVTFDAPDLSKSSKEAHNKAAEVAFQHFAGAALSTPSPSSFPSLPPLEIQIPYKTQLQTYVQRKRIGQPKYDSVREGSAHALRFKATVTVDGQIFCSPQFFSTLREAEHDAAKVALMSLSLEENQEEEPNFYKNLLQGLAQKQGLSLPTYTTVRDGACHMPIFSCTVEIEGESFTGNVARTKKQAETNSAKVAWCALNERVKLLLVRESKLPTCLSSIHPVQEDSEPASSWSPSTAIKNFEQHKPLSVSVSYIKTEDAKNDADKDQEDEVAVKDEFSTASTDKSLQDDQGAHTSKAIIVNGYGHIDKSSTYLHKPEPKTIMGNCNGHINKSATYLHKPYNEVTRTKENSMEDNGARGETLSSSTPSSCSDCPSADVNTGFPIGKDTCSLLCNRVRVYPRVPDMVLPEDVAFLPFSDDMWVAVSLDFSSHQNGVLV